MADVVTKPASADPAPPAPPAPVRTIDVLIARDYWPKCPASAEWLEANTPETGDVPEYRIRAGEIVSLPLDEAVDVLSDNIGSRVKP